MRTYLIFDLQKLDFAKSRKWREERASKMCSRISKKGAIVDLMRSDAEKLGDGSLRARTYLPPGVTSDDQRLRCCTTAFCKLYGLSSKTKCAYWKVVVDGAEVEQLEQHELYLAKNEGRRQQTLLWMKQTFHVLCDILPTSDYSKKNYHLPKCMSKNALHNEYWTEFKDKQAEHGDDYKPYHRTTFAKLWLSEFSYVQIPEHTAFSVCVHCSALHDRLISATKTRDRPLQRKIQTLRKLHLRFVAGERLTYREHQTLARDHPDLYECLCIDGMDQAKLRSPHFAGGGIPKSDAPHVFFFCNLLNMYCFDLYLFFVLCFCFFE